MNIEVQSGFGFAGQSQFGGTGEMSPLRILRRHLRLIALVLFGAVALVGAYILLAKPNYTATATIQVASDEQSSEDSGAAGPARPLDEQRIVTQIELLNSMTLARAVVKKFNLVQDPEFSVPHRSIRRRLGLLPPHDGMDPDDALAVREAAVIARLAQHVTIARVGTTHLITITARTHDAGKSMRIANAFASLHIDRIRREQAQVTARSLSALEAQVDDLRRRATLGERAAASYGRSQSLIGSPGQAADPAAVDWLAGQLATARTSRAEAQARMNQFSSDTGTSAGLSSVNTTPLLNELRVQHAGIEKRLAELQAQFGPAYPEVIALRAQRDDLTARIADERRRVDRGLAADVRVANAREGQLASEAAAVRSQALHARDAGVGFGDIQSGAQTLRSQYVAQLARLQEMRARHDTMSLDAAIAVKALLPTAPSDPKPLPLLAVAIVGGLVLGAIAAVVVEQIDDRIRTGGDIRQILGVRTLGMIPELSRNDAAVPIQRLLAGNPTSAFSETARSLYLSLVPNPGAAPTCLVVTSPLPGEGKTTIAASIAAAAAMMGSPAIVIDLDLRRPAISRAMQLRAGDLDLVDYLNGRATLDQIIVTDPEAGGIAMAAINRAPADPGRYINYPLIAPLIASLLERYQLVVVNAPPVLPVSDARTLADLADATLLVVRWRRTTRVALRVAGELLSGKITAAVLNRVDYRRHAADARGDQLQYYGSYASYFGPIVTAPRSRSARAAAWVKGALFPHRAQRST